MSTTIGCPGRAYHPCPRRDGDDSNVSTQPEGRAARPADVVDFRTSPTRLQHASLTRRQRNVPTRLKRRVAWLADVVDGRLSKTSSPPLSSPTRRRRSLLMPCDDRASCPADVIDYRLSQTKLQHASPMRGRSDVPTQHNKLPTSPSAAKWRIVPEAIVRRASPWLADGVGCRMSRTKLQQASLMRRHPNVSHIFAARTRPTAHRRRAENGLALNSKFSSSAVPNSRRQAHVDETAATLPVASPKSPTAAFTKAARLDALSLLTVESPSVESPLKSCLCPFGQPRRDHRR